jgi:hypothetical protein
MALSDSNPRPMRRPLVRWLASDCGLSVILALAISAVLLGMDPPITQGVDYQGAHQFLRYYLGASIRSGELPLWNPYVALGRPFLADIEAAAFYPPNWIFIALPQTPALFLFLAFHFWLAGFFFIKLARYWSAPRDAAVALAFVYLMSGPLLGRLQGGLLGYFCGLAYWPWLFFLVERMREKICWRHWATLALATSGSFLGGHPQCFWLTAAGLSLYLLGAHLAPPWGKNVWHGLLCLVLLAGVYAFALLLCAVQLLPTMDLALQGNRQSASLQFSADGSIDGGAITSLFISQPTRSTMSWWDSNLYVGVTCALAGLLGLMQWRDARMRGLWLMGVGGFILALGQQTPVFAAAFHLLPGMGVFRMAARFATLSSWALLLAAVIFWADGKFSPQKAGLGLAVLASGVVYIIGTGNKFQNSALSSGAVLVVLALAAIWAACRGVTNIRGTGCRVLLVGLLAADSLAAAGHMWTYYQNYSEPDHGDLFAAKLRKANLYPPNGVPPRVFAPLENSGMKYGFSTVAYSCSLTSLRVWAYLQQGARLPLNYYENSYLPPDAYLAGPFPYPGMNILVGWAGGSNPYLCNPRPGDRAYLVYAWEQVPDWTVSMDRLISKRIDPTKTVLLEAPASGPLPMAGDKGHGRAVIELFRRNSISLRVESSAPALLVVAEAWYPGWRATVNGVSTDVLPANVWMRAVPVPAGESRVELYYVEPSLARGAAISLCALMILMVIGRRAWVREQKASGPKPAMESSPS